MKRLAVIDGKSVFYRGYFAMPNLSMKDGTPTGGVFGFASLALELIKKLEPDYVVVAWDKKGTSIRKRLEILPTYKAGRKATPEDFKAQIPILHELLEAFGWPLLEADDYEADDIMGALAKQATEKGIETCLITGDLDMLQLVGPLTHVYAMKKGLANIEQFDVAHFEEKYGLNVHQFVDLKALKGDSSDNIPGVPGIGEKTGITLLQEYKTLDGVYDHLDDIKETTRKKLVAGKDSAYLSKKVAEIWCDAPTPLDLAASNVEDLDVVKLATLLKKLEFTSLLRRLPKNMQQELPHDGAFDVPADVVPFEVQTMIPRELSPHVFVHFDETTNKLWLGLDTKRVHVVALEDVDESLWQALQLTTVMSYDIKALLHQLAALGKIVTFGAVHDIRQAAFLLDPLRRDRSLAGLTGTETTEPGLLSGALWRVLETQIAAFKKQPKLSRVASELDFPLTQMLFAMEHRGIQVDTEFLNNMSVELGDEYQLLEKDMFEMVGYDFNIGSPAQLSEVLFTKLQLPTQGIKKGKTGYSTGQKELDKLRGQHPIIELIEKTRELAKLKNTYIDTLPKLIDDKSRIHTTFNQDVASTGRLSSTDPNLQNIPVRTDLGRRIREAFVARPGYRLVSADYSQFELRLAAVLADDKVLINDFNGDVDIHTKTASETYGIPMDDVTKMQRRAAKVINFGVLYGMSPHGLSAATGMSFTEAKTFIDHYFELRAPIRAFIDDTLEKAKNEGYVETFYGRRRPTPDVNSTNFMIREGAKRAAANMPIQGTEADLMKKAMLQVDERIGDLGEQILQVHDSILIECPEKNVEAISELLVDVMENIAPELGIKLRVDVSSGKNWGEL